MAFGDWDDNLGLGPFRIPFAPGIGAPMSVQRIAGPMPAPLGALGSIPTPAKPPVYAQPIEHSLPPITPQENTPQFPSLGEQRATQAAAEGQRLKDTGPGVSQINNPFLRGLARFGDIAGTVLAPGITSRIPGTTLHNQVLQAQAAGNEALGEKEQQEEAQTAAQQAEIPLRKAQATKAEAEAEKALHPAPEKPEDVQHLYADAVNDALSRNVDPNQDPKVQQLADSITSLQRQPAEKTPNSEQQFMDEYKKLHPNATVADAQRAYALNKELPQRPPQVTIINPQGQIQTLHPGDTVTPGSTTPAGFNSESVNTDKQAKAEQKAKEDAKKEYELASNLVSHPSPTNDLALVMRYIGATKPDSLGKLRLNNNEVNLVYGTRSSLGDLEALAEKVRSGQSLTPQQRQDMLNTMRILSDSGGATHFVEGADHWDIPADKIDAFKKAHPNAKAQ